HAAFRAFSKAVFAEGALPEKTKQLIAVAVAHVTQCPYCIKGHTKAAKQKGATPEEIMEAIWVAAEMRAGGASAHSTLALGVLQEGDGAGSRPERTRVLSTPAAPMGRQPFGVGPYNSVRDQAASIVKIGALASAEEVGVATGVTGGIGSA